MVKSTTERVIVSMLTSELSIIVGRVDGPPGNIEVRGALYDPVNLTVIPGETVELWVNGLYKDSDVTDAYGTYSITYNFPEGRFDIYTHFDGNATFWSCDSPLVVGNYAKIAAAFRGFSVSPTSGAAPLEVSIDGTLIVEATSAPLEQRTVYLYRDDEEIDSMKTSSLAGRRGEFWFEDTLNSTGTYEYYVEFEGDDEYAGCEEYVRSLPCEVCGAPVPMGSIGSDVVCPVCHSVFEVVG